jgi:hypothetical protein
VYGRIGQAVEDEIGAVVHEGRARGGGAARQRAHREGVHADRFASRDPRRRPRR